MKVCLDFSSLILVTILNYQNIITVNQKVMYRLKQCFISQK